MWRAAVAGDDDAIVEACLALNREDPGPHPVGEERIRRTLERFRRDPRWGEARVLEVEGRFAGYALLTDFWSNEMGGRVRLVDELYLVPAYRGRGHGTALLAGLPREADPPAAIGLEVRPANRRARAFYERLGFAGSTTALYLRLPPPPPGVPQAEPTFDGSPRRPQDPRNARHRAGTKETP